MDLDAEAARLGIEVDYVDARGRRRTVLPAVLQQIVEAWQPVPDRPGLRKFDLGFALRLGLDHGLYCVGCCWAIMLLMFVVGTGNVGWMLALGAVMAVEKNIPWGRHLSRPLGGVLLATAVVITGANLWG